MKLLNLKLDHQAQVFDLRLKPIETNITTIIDSIKNIETLIERALRGDPTLVPGQAEQMADWKGWRVKVDGKLDGFRDDKLEADAVGKFSARLVAVVVTIAGLASGATGAVLAHLLTHP